MNWHQKLRYDDSPDDKPPYSRLFIVCSKQTTIDDLRTAFEPYGDIEDIYLPKDRNSGEPKGVAYIKYSKTSSAAKAIEKRHLKPLESTNKTIKVMVASNKGIMPSHNENENKYKRLFIKVNKDVAMQDIKDHFSAFGELESVRLQKNKLTNECKGFAYVYYRTFLEAAKAYEECDRQYKPIFATPREELKRSRNSLESFNDSFHSHNSFHRESYNKQRCDISGKDISSFVETNAQDFTTVIVTCNPPVFQKYIESLCNIIPGVKTFNYSSDPFNRICKAVVSYSSEKLAAFAVERLNNFEFPSGEVISVKPDHNPLTKVASNLTDLVNTFKSRADGAPDLLQLAEAMAEASNIIKAVSAGRGDVSEVECSVSLPPVQPLADSDSRVAQRCFLIFKPHPPPLSVIKDAFCRFGDLIEVSIIPNKCFGFAKYASEASAQNAIKTLHEATLNGILVKVNKAHEKGSKDSLTVNDDEHDSEVKRMKYDKN